MADFVVDKGLDVLLRQINEKAPNRSKASDGSVGDLDHQTRDSEHNPEDTEDSSDGNDPDNQVDARDFTHDPGDGADMAEISEALRLSRDPRILLVIFNRRIFSSYSTSTRRAWEWGPYSGDNPHDKHMHVSVNDTHNDQTQPWEIGGDVELTDKVRYVKGPGVSYSADAVPLETILGQILYYLLWTRNQVITATAADETRDKALQATVEAIASAGGIEAAPIVAAIQAATAQTNSKVAELQAALADRDERLALALAGS